MHHFILPVAFKVNRSKRTLFTVDGKTEAQRGYGTCPIIHSKPAAELWLKPRPPGPQVGSVGC
jgi:hypothetical protein